MNNIIQKQINLQLQYASDIDHVIDPYALYREEEITMGELYDYVKANQFFLNEEITEILEALGYGSRNIHKPWSKEYELLRRMHLHTNPDIVNKIKEESIDALCFMLNICIALGIDHTNIDEEYDKVYTKNTSRIRDKNK